MLAKLIKYDFRSGVKTFWPFWLAIVLLFVLSAISINANINMEESSFIAILPMIALFAVMVSAAVMTLVYICRQYFTGLLGDSGYLMFSLPVESGSLIHSKSFTAIIMLVITSLAVFIGGLAMLWIAGLDAAFTSFRNLFNALRSADIPAKVIWASAGLVLMSVILALVSTYAWIMHFYAAMSLGHLFRANRALMSILAFFAIGSVLSALARTCFLLADKLNIHIPEIGMVLMPDGTFHYNGLGTIAIVLAVLIAEELIKGVALFFASRTVLTHRLNLD